MINTIILSFFLFFTTLSAKTILIDNAVNTIEILPSSVIYIDNTKLLDFNDIIKINSEFSKVDKKRLSFGYSPDFNVWLKFSLKNNTDRHIIKILEYSNPFTTHISLYEERSKIRKDEGLFQINEKRRTVNPYFKIELEPNEEKTYYLKSSSHITAMIVQLKLWDKESFYNKELSYQSILQLFFGAMLVLALYNFFVYIFTKDISYFYYVIYLFGVIIHQLAYSGIWNIYLLSQNGIITSVNFASLVSLFPILMLSLFIKSFLQINQYYWINKVMNILLILAVLALFVFIFIGSFNNYRNFVSMIIVVYLIFITIYSVLQKNRQAYFILVGWILIGSASLLMYFNSIGIFNIYEYFPYFIECAFISEAILFSIALADRINHLQYERDDINKRLMIQKETEKERLQSEVKNKTNELQIALNTQTTLLRELNHRVKNNMQTIISLVRLQSDEVEDQNIHEIFTTIESRISAMSYLHELLYQKSDISYVNTHEYFELLIDNLQNSFDNEIDIEYKINLNLQVETAISCGLILNELIINSFKYAFIDNTGKIKVELYKENEVFHFNIIDDGKGYDNMINKNSFGLVLVSTLVEDHLQGTIFTNSKNGVLNKITWSEDD